jgi:hypothetical protein
MLDVTLDLPLDLKRICQANAKVYLTDIKQFGVVTSFSDIVNVKLDQGRASSTQTFSKDEFLDKIANDVIVSKSRVIVPEGDSGSIKIKPRVKASEVPSPITMDPKQFPQLQVLTVAPALPVPQEKLLTGYIDEKTGKFSKTLQTGFTEIHYKKVTRKVQLELDSVQLQKLKELGIILDD